MIKLMQGDCLEKMQEIPDGTIDLILTDPPYQKTKCAWDSIIPLPEMWAQLERVIKPNGAIVLFGRQPFTTKLIASNYPLFRQTWIWDKVIGVNFMNAKKMHTQGFEDVVVFYKKLPTYNPQMEAGTPYKENRVTEERIPTEALGSRAPYVKHDNKGERYPRGMIKFSGRNNKPLHPTQKPVGLMEYFIMTYSNEGDLVLDFAAGSFSTGIAVINTGRSFIGIELDKEYFQTGKARINKHLFDNLC